MLQNTFTYLVVTQWEVNKIMMTETWKTVVRVECLRERREVIRVHAQGTGREKNIDKFFHFNEKQDRERHIYICMQGVCRCGNARTYASFLGNAFCFLENKEKGHQLRRVHENSDKSKGVDLSPL